MYAPHIDDSPELKYAKEQIDREQRKLDEYKKKLNFESQEQLKREEQFTRRQSTEREKLQAILHRQLDAFRQNQRHLLESFEDKIRDSHTNLQRLSGEVESTRQSFERDTKNEKKPKQKVASETRHLDIANTPDMIRLDDRIEQEKRQLRELERKHDQQERDNHKREEDFIRGQKREFEKLEHQQERELNAFKDAWERGKKFLDDKIRMTESMLTRLQADYKSKEREFEIEKRQRQKAASDRRAQQGGNDNKNYAKGADSALKGGEDTGRRRAGGRW